MFCDTICYKNQNNSTHNDLLIHYNKRLAHAMTPQLTLRGGYYNHTHRQLANLFNKVIFCVQGHVVIFVQIYAKPSIGEQIMIFRNGRSDVKSIYQETYLQE